MQYSKVVTHPLIIGKGDALLDLSFASFFRKVGSKRRCGTFKISFKKDETKEKNSTSMPLNLCIERWPIISQVGETKQCLDHSKYKSIWWFSIPFLP